MKKITCLFLILLFFTAIVFATDQNNILYSESLGKMTRFEFIQLLQDKSFIEKVFADSGISSFEAIDEDNSTRADRKIIQDVVAYIKSNKYNYEEAFITFCITGTDTKKNQLKGWAVITHYNGNADIKWLNYLFYITAPVQ